MIRAAVAAIALSVIACGEARDLPPAPTADGGTVTADGLPCDVAKVFADRCISCHSHPPRTGIPNALVTYDDLAAADPYDATKTNAQASLSRMKAGTMPPGGGLSAPEIAAVEAWVDAGAPKGTCDPSTDGGSDGGSDGGTPTPDPLPDLGPGCSIGQGTTSRGPAMRPGQACIACHSADEGPVYPVMGTVYPSVREADLCKGIAGITIEITDKNGVVHTGTANSAGNFMIGGSIPKPYTAKVKHNGKERAMIGPQTNGDCNSCHTGPGSQGAPGRVVAP